MAQQHENPIYWDQSASRFNLTLIFSLVVAILGIMINPVLIILGVGMAAYSWLTTARQFLLYRDTLVIVYGMPRTRVISFAEISHVELLAMPMGERLRIRMISGSRLMLMMSDPGTFRGHLEDALARYHGEQSGAAYVEGTAVLQRGGEPEYDAVEAELEVDFYEGFETDAPETPHETPSGSYSEVEEESQPAESQPAESQPAESQPAESETYTRQVEEPTITSGNYTETLEPDYSGEGRSAYGADVDLATGLPEDDPSERPPSPY